MNAREDWLAERRTGIGGSDAAAIMGLNRWRTPFDVYQDKLGLAAETPDNPSMLWGRLLEPIIRQQYADRTGREVVIPEHSLVHPEHAWMRANLDGATADHRIFEAKTARVGGEWGEPGSDQVPQSYLLQVQHYMAVTGYPVADLAVLIGGSDFRIYEIPADAELQALMIEAEADFWAHVQRREPPAAISEADAQARFGRASKPGSVIADDAIAADVITLHTLRGQIKGLQDKEAEARGRVMAAMGDADTLVSDTGAPLATWKASKPAQRFDSKAFKDAQPALYQQFIKVGEPSRRFILK